MYKENWNETREKYEGLSAMYMEDWKICKNIYTYSTATTSKLDLKGTKRNPTACNWLKDPYHVKAWAKYPRSRMQEPKSTKETDIFFLSKGTDILVLHKQKKNQKQKNFQDQ